jgi:hypothetical protein
MRTVIVALAFGVAASAAAQGSGDNRSWTPPRTADGQPDIQGTWNNIDSFFTPLQRPAKLADKTEVTDAELRAVLEEEASRKLEAADAGTGSYGHEWFEYKRNTIRSAPSLIVEPKDGRIPAMTAWGKEKTTFARAHMADAPETIEAGDRCVSRGILGMMLPTFYNNGKQIVQSPGYVMILSEMIHDVRIIPLDGRAHLPSSVRSWHGDSRGRWEGNTLVVETTNFSAAGNMRNVGVQTESLRVVERFTPTDANTLVYRVTIEDPKMYAAPWTIEFPFKRDNDYQMFEYACHEGNYAVPNILRGARYEEREGKSTAR